MLVRTIDDFVEAWNRESETTHKVLSALSDASLAQKVSPEGRTLGFLAWHLATTIPEMLGHAGVPASGPAQDAPVPKHAREIADAYRKAAASVPAAVRKTWSDAQLTTMIPMYGESWPCAGVLGGLLFHEVHHRGQMTVLMRQAGLRVPGVYGPAREDWASMGMQTQP